MIYMEFPGGRRKAFTLSYDDGARQDKHFIEILDRYGLKATFNINSGMFEEKNSGTTGRMSRKEIAELFENAPHEVAVHGLEHGYDNLLHQSAMAYEIMEDRKNIEELTGRVIRGMAYPFGTYSNELMSCLRSCGIVYSRTVKSTERFDMPSDWLQLHPSCHHSNKKIFELCDKFIESKPQISQMFYVWGHTFEFDYNEGFNSWEHIGNFAEKISGHDDIWYATNIEIYDYTKAYERLVVSADSKMIYNPSVIPVWFKQGALNDEGRFCIQPGETLRLK